MRSAILHATIAKALFGHFSWALKTVAGFMFVVTVGVSLYISLGFGGSPGEHKWRN